MSGAAPEERFGDRVEAYVRYRPTYPPEIVDVVREETGLGSDAVIADVGSGTGISTRIFLDAGHAVHAVEPNAPMRSAAEAELGARAGFRSHAGTAERTGLPDASVDLVVAAQAFHWFDPGAAAREWTRILRPGGWRVLVWNTRLIDASPFARAYETLLLEHGTDYTAVNHQHNADAGALDRVLGRHRVRRALPNAQVLDRDGLVGRILSASYVPNRGDPGHAPLVAAIERCFDEHARDGRVRLPYETELHLGRG